MGETGEQAAPLGRAVIGGLFASTFAALFILPLLFVWMKEKSTFDSESLLPQDEPDNQKLLVEKDTYSVK